MRIKLSNNFSKVLLFLLVGTMEFGFSGCDLLFSSGSSVSTNPEFQISVKELQLEVFESVQLTTNSDSEVIWISEDESVATVNDAGKVVGESIGETLIIAVSQNLQALCRITVVENVSGFKKGYTMVWHDEFSGNSLNTDNWSYQLGTQDFYGSSTGPASWGNNELQYYTQDNLKVEDGTLVITAKKEEETIGGKSYTSSRITTRDNFSFTYGYVEARIKSPVCDGMWPAFWMLPQPSTTENSHNIYGGWPANGELDIMEAKGRLQNRVDTTLHCGQSGGNDYVGETTTLTSGIDEWHTYALDWQKEYIAWVIDGTEVLRVNYDRWWTGAVSSSENPYAPFDQPFFILLNLAVGGTYDPVGTENLKNNEDFISASMYVDYVRVYTVDIG